MITGIVQRGSGISGRIFGVPTANLVLSEMIDLAYGTYAGYATWKNETFRAMIYYGANDPHKIEVHLFHFDSNLYGEEITVDPQKKIAECIPWSTEDAMKEKVATDRERVLQWFTAA